MRATTGWSRSQYGSYVKEINGHWFRLWRHGDGWRITYESMEKEPSLPINDAKRLAHKIAETLP